MRFLSPTECVDWCSNRGFPTEQLSNSTIPVAESRPVGFHFARFRHPADSGRKVWLASFLYSQLEASSEALVWLGSWGVWPSSQHMPLVTRLREALGERRPLIESPGHLVGASDDDDAISLLAVSLLFVWDCHVISASGRDVLFTSHDEYGWFGSRDELVARRVRVAFEKASV